MEIPRLTSPIAIAPPSIAAPPPPLAIPEVVVVGTLTFQIALGFSFPIAPSNLKSAWPGKRRYTAAAVSVGSIWPGRRKTTIWENAGDDGKENANWVSVSCCGGVRQGRPGRMRENIFSRCVPVMNQGGLSGIPPDVRTRLTWSSRQRMREAYHSNP